MFNPNQPRNPDGTWARTGRKPSSFKELGTRAGRAVGLSMKKKALITAEAGIAAFGAYQTYKHYHGIGSSLMGKRK